MKGKFWISFVAMFVMSMALGLLIHGFLLANDYARLPNLMRSQEAAQEMFPYMLLAHAFIATQLNGLNDAFVPQDVQEAFDGAAVIFADYTPADIAALKGKNATQLRAEMLGYAYILDQYNNGLAADGPPHCSE